MGGHIFLGLGDPVTDVVVEVSHEFLSSVADEPGGCCAINASALKTIVCKISETGYEMTHIPGGSAANVVSCMAMLKPQEQCTFTGGVGSDAAAQHYERVLEARGVLPALVTTSTEAPSAVSICMITPDGQRTMRTCLGAAARMSPDHLPQSQLQGCKLVHCEGYCLYKPALLRHAVQLARKAGALTSLDLASFEVIRNCRETLLDVLRSGCIDVVFCNEDEAAALSPAPSEDQGQCDAERLLLQHCKVAVFTLGSKGARACSSWGNSASARAPEIAVKDTVGAGDYFCGAFLAAYMQGGSLAQCCQVGCLAGAAVVQCVGANLSSDAQSRLKQAFDSVMRGE